MRDIRSFFPRRRRMADRNKRQSAMKTIPVSLIFASLLAPSAILAQKPDAPPPPNREGPQQPPARPFVQAWKQADKDGDGFLTRGEFDAMPRIQRLPEDKRAKIFARLDKDGDSRLNRQELSRQRRPQDGPRHPPMHRLWELDTDKSGGISPEEFKAGHPTAKLPPDRQMEIFRRLDRDGDGEITRKDKPEPPHRMPPPDQRPPRPDAPGENPDPKPPEPLHILRQLDKDGDGALSFEEFRAGPMVKRSGEDEQEDRFEAMDRNKDGKITPDEIRPLTPPRGESRSPRFDRQAPPPSDEPPPEMDQGL